MEPQESGLYVLLSNIYATVERWEDVGKVRKIMKDRIIKKNPGCSWMEVRNIVHSFMVNDSSHPQIREIRSLFEAMSMKMKDARYIPNKKIFCFMIWRMRTRNNLSFTIVRS